MDVVVICMDYNIWQCPYKKTLFHTQIKNIFIGGIEVPYYSQEIQFLKLTSKDDMSTYPLFGDSGTCTAIELVPEDNQKESFFNLGAYGSAYDMIMVKGGDSRVHFLECSLSPIKYADNVFHNNLELSLNGMDVFLFGINIAPKCINELCDRFHISINDKTLVSLHQANKPINKNILQKLGLLEKQFQNSLKDFGNTSSASIPLSLFTQCKDKLKNECAHITCCFGVGATCGSAYFKTSDLVIPDLIEI